MTNNYDNRCRDLNTTLADFAKKVGQLSGQARENFENQVAKITGMDTLNVKYFLALYAKYQAKEILDDKFSNAHPTAIAPAEILNILPLQHYEDLLKNNKKDFAAKSLLWIKKMQAGTGSSIKRSTYLALKKKIAESSVVIGGKGNDLFVPGLGDGMVSLAEAQIMQAIYDMQSNKYAGIILHDIISSETEKSINEIWQRKSLADATQNYRELILKIPGLQSGMRSYQYHIPTIDEKGELSFNRRSPGGHALFGVEALLAAACPEQLPKVGPGQYLLSVIGNGEDLSSTPDEYMAHWMVENKIPIAMVTTTKTEIDLKGGQIAIVSASENENAYVTIIERAQAESAGQGELFERLGLRAGDREAFFNTNMILLNYHELSPRLEKLRKEVGEIEFLKIISPDLIKNIKKQVDHDGVERKYIQLEGAMGSSMLNLDRYWRRRFGHPLVHILNVGVQDRSRFFSPIKTAFDFFLQFYSDRFSFDKKSYRLINNAPSSLPDVSLSGKVYNEVQSLLDNFAQSEILHLKKLKVVGDVSLADLVLKGKVEIESQKEGLVNLAMELSLGLECKCILGRQNNKFILENVKITISRNGEIGLCDNS